MSVPAAESACRAKYIGMSGEQLRRQCADSWLEEGGTKADMVERLVDYEKPAGGWGGGPNIPGSHLLHGLVYPPQEKRDGPSRAFSNEQVPYIAAERHGPHADRSLDNRPLARSDPYPDRPPTSAGLEGQPDLDPPRRHDNSANPPNATGTRDDLDVQDFDRNMELIGRNLGELTSRGHNAAAAQQHNLAEAMASLQSKVPRLLTPSMHQLTILDTLIDAATTFLMQDSKSLAVQHQSSETQRLKSATLSLLATLATKPKMNTSKPVGYSRHSVLDVGKTALPSYLDRPRV
jgi:hypothetical protein